MIRWRDKPARMTLHEGERAASQYTAELTQYMYFIVWDVSRVGRGGRSRGGPA